MDHIDFSFKGINLNFFQKWKRTQKIAFAGAMVFLGMWIIFGFDSTPLQFIHVIYEGIPKLFAGGSFNDLVTIYNSYYGKEMHYSAFVIYFLLYWGASRAWEKAGIVGSKNMVFSFAGMFLAIAVFEWFWILSFSTFQNQPWVSTWRFPQMKILLQNTFFSLAGGVTVLYMLTERFHWNGKEMLGRAYFFDAKSWKLWLCVGLSVALALLWIYYPWDVHQIIIRLESGGFWESSRMFPQTLYTVDLNPLDSVNAGVWFWVENDLIHGLNTLVKVVWALTVFLLFKPKALKTDATIYDQEAGKDARD